jgi:hypothetical protein
MLHAASCIFVVYLALGLLMTWPLAARAGAQLPGLGDALLQTWILAWNAHSLRGDPGAIWQMPIFYPYPDTAAYHDNLLVQSALAAPLIWLTRNPILAYNLLILLSFALTGLAVYLLARDVAAEFAPAAPPAARAWGAFVAGCGVAFCAYRMAHLVQLNLLQTAWLIFALHFLRRLLRPRGAGGGRWRDALLVGLFVGLQMASDVYYGYFALLVLGGYSLLWALARLWWRARAGEALPWWMLPRLGLAGAVALLCCVPLLLPYLAVYRTLGIVRSLQELDGWSAPLRAYISVPASNRLYGPLGELVVDSGEMVLFPGLSIALLALIAIGMGINAGLRRFSTTEYPQARRGDLLFWALLAPGAALLSFGTALRLVRYGDPLPVPLPYLTLYGLVPGFGSMRVPARWGWLVTLALATLSGAAITVVLARLRPPWRHVLGAALAAAVLAEQAAFPVPLSPAVAADVPPVYAWLGEPAQAELTTVLELPVGPTPRGEELERIMLRQFYGSAHWKRLPVAFSGLIPFGTTELLRRVQAIPDADALEYLQLVGVDTLVLHSDEYGPGALAQLREGLSAHPSVRHRADVGASLVYTLDAPPAFSLPRGSIFISNDERMPGLPTLGLLRRWLADGHALYGPGRLRFYAPLDALSAGQVADYGLLASGEDPRAYGFDSARALWSGQGLALYQRGADLLASLALARPVAGQFHPRAPGALELRATDSELMVGDQAVPWPRPPAQVWVELDVASLAATELTVGADALTIPAGLSTVGLSVPATGVLRVEGPESSVALLRVRALDRAGGRATVEPERGLAATAQVGFQANLLTVEAQGAGASAVGLEIVGAAAADDSPINLLAGSQPAPPAGQTLVFAVDLLAPQPSWAQSAEPPRDGRFIVYIKDGDRGDGPGLPVATFNLRGGQVVDAMPVPLPLAAIP